MKTRITGLLLTGVFVLAMAGICLADVVIMENGQTYKGQVLKLDRSANQLVVDVKGKGGVKVLKFRDVKSITITRSEVGKTAGQKVQAATDKIEVLEDNAGDFNWEHPPEVQTRIVKNGKAAFRSTGPSRFFKRGMAVVGNDPGQYRYLEFWLFLQNAKSDMLLQVNANSDFWRRWGFDGDSKYNGYDPDRVGETTGMRWGKWHKVRVDLINQLKLKPGMTISGLGFSSKHGDMYFDSVYLVPANE